MTIMDRPALALVARNHPHCNLGAFALGAASERPASRAVLDLSDPNPVWLTYAELEDRINQCVSYLGAVGIRRGHRVGIGLPNSLGFLVAQLALMRGGAVPVLINPRLPFDTVRFMVGDADMTHLLVDLDDVPALQGLSSLPGLRALFTPGTLPKGWNRWAASEHAGRSDKIEVMSFDEQALQAYTAGSTGIPKGIVLTHGGQLWGIEHNQLYWPLDTQQRGIVAAPMFHKNAMRGTIKPLMRAAGSFVILPRFDPSSYLAALSEHEITFCGGVPAMFAEILKLSPDPTKLAKLESIGMGSSTVPQELVTRLKAALPHVSVKEGYGLTEGGGPLRPDVSGRPTPQGSVGLPAPEYEVRLANARQQDGWTTGELEIRSPYVVRQYYKRPDLTEARLKDGWLNTGDVFKVDADGFYYFIGRSDDMFVCGGENIYPKEVEAVVMRHKAVSDVVVVPLPHETKGFAPAAVIARRPGRDVTPREVQDHCAENGPSYAIPRAVIVLDALPLTPAGKPDREAIKKMLEASVGHLRSRSAD